MKSKPTRVLCVGKIKTRVWKDAAARYLKLIEGFRPIKCEEVKDADSGLTLEKRLETETARLKARLDAKDAPICLDENGTLFSSREFAEFLRDLDLREGKRAVFVIGGAWGLSSELKKTAHATLSLSPMTFPHELARVLFLEQLFRAECILRNFPYHH